MLGSLVGVFEDHLGLLMRIVAADRQLLGKQLLAPRDPCLVGGLRHLSTVPMLWVKEVRPRLLIRRFLNEEGHGSIRLLWSPTWHADRLQGDEGRVIGVSSLGVGVRMGLCMLDGVGGMGHRYPLTDPSIPRCARPGDGPPAAATRHTSIGFISARPAWRTDVRGQT
jgi:hypothetical protein